MPLMVASMPVSGHPVRVFEALVAEVRDLSPHFRRVTLTGPALINFGVPGPTLDLRIKMLLPTPGHALRLPGKEGLLQAGWYQQWLRQDQPGRGSIRSYTVRKLRHASTGPEIDVDFVLHRGPGVPAGPGSAWAREAVPGCPAWFVGPDVAAVSTTPLPETGINWNPGTSERVLLAGDETAVPAISSILEALPPHIGGHAFLEVPGPADALPVAGHSGVQVTWLHRDSGAVPRGIRLVQAVQQAIGSHARAGRLYAWVGAEAGTMKSLRRCLTDAGVDPRASEFRGYWSLGKAGSGVNGVRLPPAP